MSKKRRKRRPRSAPQPAADPAPAAVPKPRRGNPDDERPPAPWGSFPLVELAVLVALILMVAGFVTGGQRGGTMIMAGLVVGSVAGLELAIREHFAGYRSHTMLLSGATAVGLMVILGVGVPSLWLPAAMGIAVATALLAAWALARAFRNRSGRYIKVR